MEVLENVIYKGENKDKFIEVAATEHNNKWNTMIKREEPLYKREVDIRSEFQRDYTRIIYSNAYKRLKNKTQVFFSPTNDHICTRIEHVNHVESISYTIAKELGLNVELTRAISVSHDLGHSPFGHAGEKVLNEISKRDVGKTFWHEQNGLNAVDYIELLENREGKKQNLDLTYAVRDGIISHCGEIDENGVKPRTEAIDLKEYKTVGQYQPYTWEGCVVKISDKISYIGRDIEDAVRFKMLDDDNLDELKKILNIKENGYNTLNNTNIINNLIGDLLINSSTLKGLTFSDQGLNLLNNIKQFNYKTIYSNERLTAGQEYFKLIITKIYDMLKSIYDTDKNKIDMNKKYDLYPEVIDEFIKWLENYSINKENSNKLSNKRIYDLDKKENYYEAIIEYISGMTDNKAISTFNKIISF